MMKLVLLKCSKAATLMEKKCPQEKMFFCDIGSRIKKPFLYIFILYSKLSGFSVLYWYNIFGVRLYI